MEGLGGDEDSDDEEGEGEEEDEFVHERPLLGELTFAGSIKFLRLKVCCPAVSPWNATPSSVLAVACKHSTMSLDSNAPL